MCVLAANFVDFHWKPIFRAEDFGGCFCSAGFLTSVRVESYFPPLTGTGQRLRFAFSDTALIVSLEAARALRAS